MSEPFYYPPLPDASQMRNIETVRLLLTEHPSYFLESPYDGEQAKFMNKWFKTKQVEKDQQGRIDADGVDESERFTDLETELKVMYGLLKSRRPSPQEDAIAYLKASTSMLEKITRLQAQNAGIKQVSDFQRVVMDIMENVCSAEQRAEFLKRLGPIAVGFSEPETPEEDEAE